MSGAGHGIEALLGDAAWLRLPAAVRERFMDPARRVDYKGTFEIVRASRLGRVLAWFCRCLGTPVVPKTGAQVPALVQVVPTTMNSPRCICVNSIAEKTSAKPAKEYGKGSWNRALSSRRWRRIGTATAIAPYTVSRDTAESTAFH